MVSTVNVIVHLQFCLNGSSCGYKRPHWRAQVKLHMRMADVPAAWHSADVPVRADIPHPVPYRRETIHLPEARYVSSMQTLFQCLNSLVECDKSFTRSDALAKHMRIQHNIIPPLPGRGGNRKRKREPEQSDTSHAHPIADGYSTAMFRVDQQVPVLDTHSELDIINRGSPLEPNAHLDYYHNGLSVRRSLSPEVNIEGEDDDDDLPPHLAALLDPTTGLIMGRSPAFVKYIVWKAKHRHVLREHEDLIEQLRSVRWEEKCWRQRKDALLDEVLRVTFG